MGRHIWNLIKSMSYTNNLSFTENKKIISLRDKTLVFMSSRKK